MTGTSTRSCTSTDVVSSVSRLVAAGMTRDQVRARLDSNTWRRFGRAVVLHNGPPTPAQRHEIALVNAGPRSVLTGLTALEQQGLTSWRRDARHLLVPAGATVRAVRGIEVVVHRVADWSTVVTAPGRPRVHALPDAAVGAAGWTTRPRTAVALLAAVVQQELTTVESLRVLVADRHNLRHRATLLASLDDIAMGAQALSEIDFALLCRRAGLVEPRRQAVRVENDGRRRYLDAEWIRADGRRVVAEVDGALHLQPRRWWDDQFRQNEIVLDNALVLRFPSVVVREGDPRIVDQLARAGVPRRHH